MFVSKVFCRYVLVDTVKNLHGCNYENGFVLHQSFIECLFVFVLV